jgi:hypothetical protein
MYYLLSSRASAKDLDWIQLNCRLVIVLQSVILNVVKDLGPSSQILYFAQDHIRDSESDPSPRSG